MRNADSYRANGAAAVSLPIIARVSGAPGAMKAYRRRAREAAAARAASKIEVAHVAPDMALHGTQTGRIAVASDVAATPAPAAALPAPVGILAAADAARDRKNAARRAKRAADKVAAI